MSGRIAKVNGALVEGDQPARPELLNESPYEKGWLAEVEMSDPSELDDMLSPEDYRKTIGNK